MELKIGDKIYGIQRSKISGVYIVERLTNKMAVCENNLFFIKEYNESTGYVQMVGNNKNAWDRTFYYMETDKLKDQLFLQNAIYQISKFSFDKLSIDQLKAILHIIEDIN